MRQLSTFPIIALDLTRRNQPAFEMVGIQLDPKQDQEQATDHPASQVVSDSTANRYESPLDDSGGVALTSLQ